MGQEVGVWNAGTNMSSEISIKNQNLHRNLKRVSKANFKFYYIIIQLNKLHWDVIFGFWIHLNIIPFTCCVGRWQWQGCHHHSLFVFILYLILCLSLPPPSLTTMVIFTTHSPSVTIVVAYWLMLYHLVFFIIAIFIFCILLLHCVHCHHLSLSWYCPCHL